MPQKLNNMSLLSQLEKQNNKNSHWSFFGSYMQQHPNAVLSLNRLLNSENFDNIIEIGTHDGGLSTLFALYCFGSKHKAYAGHPNEPSLYKNHTHHKRPKSFHTFDIMMRDIPRIEFLKVIGTNFYLGDCLNDAGVIEYIASLIREGGRTLLLCDGGDKVKEFETYSKYLKVGDVIMAHDWFFDSLDFESAKNNGEWYSHETSWADIEGSCTKNGIEMIYSDEFDQAFWFCGKKVK